MRKLLAFTLLLSCGPLPKSTNTEFCYVWADTAGSPHKVCFRAAKECVAHKAKTTNQRPWYQVISDCARVR